MMKQKKSGEKAKKKAEEKQRKAEEEAKKKVMGAMLTKIEKSVVPVREGPAEISAGHYKEIIEKKQDMNDKFDEEKLKKIINDKCGSQFKLDDYGIDGDFIESQAFGYLAIRSYLGLPITFPNTTGCKKPTTGGVLVKNY